MNQMIRNSQQATNMNLNMAPHPAGSKSGELVPSRYAVSCRCHPPCWVTTPTRPSAPPG